MRLYGIFGYPITHSISPRLHNNAFHAFEIDACYGRFAIEDPDTLMHHFHALGLEGANVTIPHKEVAYAQCDEVRGVAKEIQAVNTLVKEGTKVIGYNTDAQGFYEAIRSFGPLSHALILGAGGSAKAVAIILRTYGVRVSLLNRSRERLNFFASQGFETHTWEDFTPQKYDLIINTTSAGLRDETLPCPQTLLEPILKHSSFAYDLIYNHPTPFLRLALTYGLTCKDGKEMLLHQAILAFNLFFQNRFEPLAIERAMRPIFDL